MKKTMTYAQAIERLQTIVRGLENNSLGIDELTTQLDEAQKLLAFCKQRLAQTTTDLENILSNEQK